MNTVSPDDCSFVASHLQTLHSFMNNYYKMLANYTRVPLDGSRRTTVQDAHQSESKSIDCLKQLVVQSAEVFNLWKLLSEHQFYIIANKLSEVCVKFSNSIKTFCVIKNILFKITSGLRIFIFVLIFNLVFCIY